MHPCVVLVVDSPPRLFPSSQPVDWSLPVRVSLSSSRWYSCSCGCLRSHRPPIWVTLAISRGRSPESGVHGQAKTTQAIPQRSICACVCICNCTRIVLPPFCCRHADTMDAEKTKESPPLFFTSCLPRRILVMSAPNIVLLGKSEFSCPEDDCLYACHRRLYQNLSRPSLPGIVRVKIQTARLSQPRR
jgi:hypothetical protein